MDVRCLSGRALTTILMTTQTISSGTRGHLTTDSNLRVICKPALSSTTQCEGEDAHLGLLIRRTQVRLLLSIRQELRYWLAAADATTTADQVIGHDVAFGSQLGAEAPYATTAGLTSQRKRVAEPAEAEGNSTRTLIAGTARALDRSSTSSVIRAQNLSSCR